MTRVTEPQQGASYDDLLAVAQATEALGFDGFFRSDHFQRMGDGDPSPGPTDAWTTLAGLARETSRIRLGTLVTSATFRHPGVLAIQVAQVDQMSGGRVELGLGAGWFEAEHAAYGIPFPEAVRVAHRTAGDPHRAVGHGRGGAIHLHRGALHADELAELPASGIAGSTAAVTDALGALAELGASRVYLQVLDLRDLDHLDLVAREVMPAPG